MHFQLPHVPRSQLFTVLLLTKRWWRNINLTAILRMSGCFFFSWSSYKTNWIWYSSCYLFSLMQQLKHWPHQSLPQCNRAGARADLVPLPEDDSHSRCTGLLWGQVKSEVRAELSGGSCQQLDGLISHFTRMRDTRRFRDLFMQLKASSLWTASQKLYLWMHVGAPLDFIAHLSTSCRRAATHNSERLLICLQRACPSSSSWSDGNPLDQNAR